MQIIRVRTPSSPCAVACGAGILRHARALAAKHAGEGPLVAVSSPTVWKHCGAAIRRGFAGALAAPILFNDSEKAKTMAAAERIARELVLRGARRDAILVAAGGGVVGDVAGFVAATYLRGVRCIQIPTTLLAQVDSSIGGKTGVNLPEGKNLMGAFHQPSLVLCDPLLLKSLSRRVFRSGLYEVTKYAMLGDAKLFRTLERNLENILRRDPFPLVCVIERCIRIKAGVVGKDERDTGPRQSLNLGHTLGHALESATKYRRYYHGEAVAWGLLAAMLVALARGQVSVEDAARAVQLIARMGPLPKLPNCPAARIWQYAQADKKSRHGHVDWILPVGIGRVRLRQEVSRVLFGRVWRELPAVFAGGRL